MYSRAIPGRSVSLPALLAAIAWPSIGLPADFAIVAPDDKALVVEGGEVRVRLNTGGCDDNHTSACSAVLQRSEYVLAQPHAHGDRITYSWEIFVPEDFRYTASGGYLRAVRFMNGEDESVFSFLLDTGTGYSVSRKPCFGTDGFGSWHEIAVRVAWDSTKKKGLKDKTPGDLNVTCDGQVVLSRAGRPNIGAEELVWFSLGLAGALHLPENDNATVIYRNVEVATW